MGLPTVFVRLTGCPLRCQYCDTSYAFSGGEIMSIESILSQIEQYHTNYVTVTGGEPLAQKECVTLLAQICDRGYEVSLETSGAIDVSGVDPRVVKIVDIKTPGSGECAKNLYKNLEYMTKNDQIKFVICDEEDYLWSKKFLKNNELSSEVLFSPSYEQLEAKILSEWILRDQLPVRLQIQLHKYLWNDEPGR